eukprot:TRINITY_DN693_c0_g1_i2.p1 TRINITY_DN693_c0_g1~~TRINITY_DN693_c0_g1_i2.p1  ORF type:complete len:586 (+),score=131.49 TRINITY_DN693_c0_g1_i2:63-1820(+)
MSLVNRQRLSPSSPLKTNPVEALHVKLTKQAGHLIEALDRVRMEVGKDTSFSVDFPQIIVAGEEKTGKSTLLERIAGLKFFPRDIGICTRMPMKLVLKHLDSEEMRRFCKSHNLDDSQNAYCRLKFEGTDGTTVWSEKFYKIEEVEAEVRMHMDSAVKRKNGGKSVTGITEDILSIDITSTNVPNLTLIDLPGIFSVQKDGEPDDMPEATKRLVDKYMSQPHTMVLVVVPAHHPIRNSQAVKLVLNNRKEPYTIGVLTMADRAIDPRFPNDPYRGLKETLLGQSHHSIPLPHGWVAVRNLDMEVNDHYNPTFESSWFEENLPGFLDKGHVSSEVLISKLSSMLCKYVEKTWLPGTKQAIAAKIAETKKSIGDLGTDPASNPQAFFSQVMKRFAEVLKERVTSLIPRIPQYVKTHLDVRVPTLEQPLTLNCVQKWETYQTLIIERIGMAFNDVAKALADEVKIAMKDSKLPIRLDRFSSLVPQLSTALTRMRLSSSQFVKQAEEDVKRFLVFVGNEYKTPPFAAITEMAIMRGIASVIKNLSTGTDTFGLGPQHLEDDLASERTRLQSKLESLNRISEVVSGVLAA